MLAVNAHTDLELALETRQHLAAVLKATQAELDRVTTDIKDALIAKGLDTIETEDYVAVLSVRERKTLDKGALVGLGVSTETLEKASRASTYTQLDVRERK